MLKRYTLPQCSTHTALQKTQATYVKFMLLIGIWYAIFGLSKDIATPLAGSFPIEPFEIEQMTKTSSLALQPSHTLLDHLLNFLDFTAEIAARNGDVPYSGL